MEKKFFQKSNFWKFWHFYEKKVGLQDEAIWIEPVTHTLCFHFCRKGQKHYLPITSEASFTKVLHDAGRYFTFHIEEVLSKTGLLF
jgi:hypothetical protein